MVVVDTSIWIDHLASIDTGLQTLLDRRRVLMHPFIVGEIAVGSLRQRLVVIEFLSNSPQVNIVNDGVVIATIEREKLFSIGIGVFEDDPAKS